MVIILLLSVGLAVAVAYLVLSLRLRLTAAMKVPKSGKEISNKWVEHILKEHTATIHTPARLQVDSCTVSEESRDGYNSQVVFFTVETTEKDKLRLPETKKVYHLVGKFRSQYPLSQAMNEKLKTTFMEHFVYTELISTMNNMLNAKAPEEPKISVPKLVYGKCTSREFVLVMENLQYSGYEMNDKRKGLNGEELKAAVDQIARVHALSYVFRESFDVSKYSCFRSTEEYVNLLSLLIGTMLDICIKFLATSKETEDLSKKMHQCKSTLLERFTASIRDDCQIKCLVHGDCWSNNLMFKYNDASNGQKIVEKVKIIDWAVASWGTPAYDLVYLVYTSTTRTVREDHLEEALNHYHQTFMRLTTKLGSPPSKWSFEQLKSEWNKAYVHGFLYSCVTIQGGLSTTNPVNKKMESSVLDKPLLFPLRFIVDGMKMGAAKVIASLTLSAAGKKFLARIVSKMFMPVLEELKSGKNEVLNTRLLEIIYEADENGLFAT